MPVYSSKEARLKDWVGAISVLAGSLAMALWNWGESWWLPTGAISVLDGAISSLDGAISVTGVAISVSPGAISVSPGAISVSANASSDVSASASSAAESESLSGVRVRVNPSSDVSASVSSDAESESPSGIVGGRTRPPDTEGGWPLPDTGVGRSREPCPPATSAECPRNGFVGPPSLFASSLFASSLFASPVLFASPARLSSPPPILFPSTTRRGNVAGESGEERPPPAVFVFPSAVFPRAVLPPAVFPPAVLQPAAIPPAVLPPATAPPAVLSPTIVPPAVLPPTVARPALFQKPPPVSQFPKVFTPAVFPRAAFPPLPSISPFAAAVRWVCTEGEERRRGEPASTEGETGDNTWGGKRGDTEGEERTRAAEQPDTEGGARLGTGGGTRSCGFCSQGESVLGLFGAWALIAERGLFGPTPKPTVPSKQLVLVLAPLPNIAPVLFIAPRPLSPPPTLPSLSPQLTTPPPPPRPEVAPLCPPAIFPPPEGVGSGFNRSPVVFDPTEGVGPRFGVTRPGACGDCATLLPQLLESLWGGEDTGGGLVVDTGGGAVGPSAARREVARVATREREVQLA